MISSKGKEMKIINWGTGIFVHRRIVSAVKRVEFVSDRLSYIVLGGRRRNTIFIFQAAIQKFKDQDIQNHNLACCFVWV